MMFEPVGSHRVVEVSGARNSLVPPRAQRTLTELSGIAGVNLLPDPFCRFVPVIERQHVPEIVERVDQVVDAGDASVPQHR